MTPAAATAGSAADVGDRRYEVHARLDIVSTMRALAKNHTLITAHGKLTNDFIITALLGVYANDGYLVFDFGADAHATERVLAASDVRFITQVDQIRVQFAARAAGTLDYEGAPAFLTRFPEVMTRLQRREFYRVRIPLTEPLSIVLTPDVGEPASLRAIDLGCGGILLGDVPPGLGASVGTTYRRCAINLPSLGSIATDVRVVRVMNDDARPGSRKVAVQFVDLPVPAMMLLQRYINRVERDRLARD
jgi:c-di-GMP-binding flagellar brake protein YcgR